MVDVLVKDHFSLGERAALDDFVLYPALLMARLFPKMVSGRTSGPYLGFDSTLILNGIC